MRKSLKLLSIAATAAIFKVFGTLSTGKPHTNTSPIRYACSPVGAFVDQNINQSFKHGTQIRGQFYHDGAWSPGVPALNIRK